MGHRGLHSEHPLYISPSRASPSVPTSHPIPSPPPPRGFLNQESFRESRGWGFFSTQQNRRVIYFAMTSVVVQETHSARQFVTGVYVCTLGNLDVEPALWLQCGVVERLSHTALGSPLEPFLSCPCSLPNFRVLCVNALGWVFCS